jgi:3-oxoacyl-[acyl-carrier protein] reductase
MALVTDLSGRVAIVTGSATGLGASFALKLAEAGASVIINYSRSAKEAEATADLCRAKGAQVQVIQANVSEDEDCKKLAEAARSYGRLDALINNAGTTKQVPDHSDLAGLDKEDFLRLYGVNVVGPFMMIRACEALLREANRQTGISSSVLNVSSIAGVIGNGSSVAYAASKGAFNTMTLSLARALAPAIRVNAVCPGFIGTRWFKDYLGAEKYGKMEESVKLATPLQVASGPDDIADAAFHFLTDASRHVTGETLITDAGLHLGYAPLKAR